MAGKVDSSKGRISAKRLLPAARAAGCDGSPRNFRRLVAEAKDRWRRGQSRGRRPGVWAPGETLLIDWGVEDGLHVFCAVLAWSRWRYVRFASDEKAATTLGLPRECLGLPRLQLTRFGRWSQAALKAEAEIGSSSPVSRRCGSWR